ncbi:MAG: hypothetical protein E7319_05020 [Clostridiales bacterium]|nr:hypothetical protein [Clostridiales bacterium]
MKRMLPLLLALILLFGLSPAAMAQAAKEAVLPDPADLAPGLIQYEEPLDFGVFWMHSYQGDMASVKAAVDAYTAYLIEQLGMEGVLAVTADPLPDSRDYAAAYRMPGNEPAGSTFAMRGDFYQVDACHVMLMFTLNDEGDDSILHVCHSSSLPFAQEGAVMEETAQQPNLPDPLDFSYGLYPVDTTTDYGYCISHTYEGDDASVQEAVEKYAAYLEEELGMKQVLYYVTNPFDENDWHYAAYLAPEGFGENSFAMGGSGDFQVQACHVFLQYQLEADYERNDLQITHSSAFPCPLETTVPVVETADIQWHQMGQSGESFYYGQYDETTGPAGFIVYESNQGSTNYGVNMGGYYDDLWDGTVIAINRERGRVDSINLITYETGNARYSTRYFLDGTITYATYEGITPKQRYDRVGDVFTTQNFYAFTGTWGGENEIGPADIRPEWGMGYASISLASEEQQTEDGLHVGSYLLTGVTDEGETVEILRLEAFADGNVEYSLNGESWRYDYAAGTYLRVE